MSDQVTHLSIHELQDRELGHQTMVVPQDQMLLTSAEFKSLLCLLSVIKQHRQEG